LVGTLHYTGAERGIPHIFTLRGEILATLGCLTKNEST
jgi:hypothetical protein